MEQKVQDSSPLLPDDLISTGLQEPGGTFSRGNDGWEKTVYAAEILNDHYARNLTMASDGNICFTGSVNGIYGIHRTEYSQGKLQIPELLPAEIHYLDSYY